MTHVCVLLMAALVAAGSQPTAVAPSVALKDLRFHLSPGYYSGDRRIIVETDQVPRPMAGPTVAWADAVQSAIDVAYALAEQAGANEQVGSMPFVIGIQPEIHYWRYSPTERFVFVTVVLAETSGKHLETASILARVVDDHSISLMFTWSLAFGPATLNMLRIVRFSGQRPHARSFTAVVRNQGVRDSVLRAYNFPLATCGPAARPVRRLTSCR